MAWKRTGAAYDCPWPKSGTLDHKGEEMNRSLRYFSLPIVILLLLTLMGAPLFAAPSSAVAGTVALDKTSGAIGTTITLTVTDTDLNVGTAVSGESVGYDSAIDVYNQPAGGAAGDTFTVRVQKFPIADSATGTNADGVVDWRDVSVNISTLSVYSVSPSQGLVTFRKASTVSSAAAFTLTYRGASVETTFRGTTAAELVSVKSGSDSGFTIRAKETNPNSGIFKATFTLAAATANASVGDESGTDLNLDGDTTDTGVLASQCVNATATACNTRPALKVIEGDTVTVSYADGSPAGTISATTAVDLTRPTITNVTPVSASSTNALTTALEADITDSGSGVSQTSIAVYNGSTKLATTLLTVTAITGGFHVKTTTPSSGVASAGTVTWHVEALDAAGNRAVSDSVGTTVCDPGAAIGISSIGTSSTTCDASTYSVDFAAPSMSSAVTGERWDSTTKNIAVTTASTSVRVLFDENLDSTTVSASDFTVGGVVPSAANVYAASTALATASQNVFLTVDALAADAKPIVVLTGSVSDKAGNAATTGTKTSTDSLKPTFTVSVTGTTATGTVGTAKTVTITVEANENSVTPAVTVTRDEASASATAVTLTVVTSQKKWSGTFTTTTADRYLVNVSGEDLAQNAATAGSTDASATTAIKFEVDNALPAPTSAISGSTTLAQANATATTYTYTKVETDDPLFVTVSWASEGTEYTSPVSAVADADTHNNVTLTKMTLDGADILSTVSPLSSTSFVIGMRDLALGKHTILVNATDDIGNKLASDRAITFEVTARADYSLALQPGMNLVSLPSDPADTAINSVLTSTLDITSVTTFDAAAADGPWLVATRNASTGLLEGSLTTIDANHAYWIDSGTAQTAKISIPKQSFTAELAEIGLVKGWNMVPVRDLGIAAQGTTQSADTTFSGLTWIKAYTFNTVSGAWTAILPKQIPADTVSVGSGYWLYVSAAGDLVG